MTAFSSVSSAPSSVPPRSATRAALLTIPISRPGADAVARDVDDVGGPAVRPSRRRRRGRRRPRRWRPTAPRTSIAADAPRQRRHEHRDGSAGPARPPPAAGRGVRLRRRMNVDSRLKPAISDSTVNPTSRPRRALRAFAGQRRTERLERRGSAPPAPKKWNGASTAIQTAPKRATTV